MARSLKAYTDDYMKLAEAGENVAQMKLGLLYPTGKKVRRWIISPRINWLNLAALRGNNEAKRLRTELADVMSREENSEAQRQAREWVSTH